MKGDPWVSDSTLKTADTEQLGERSHYFPWGKQSSNFNMQMRNALTRTKLFRELAVFCSQGSWTDPDGAGCVAYLFSNGGVWGLAERQAALLIKAPAGLQRASRVAEEFSDTVLCERGRVGQTALDGVAGDGACQDPGAGAGTGRGVLITRNAGLGRAGQGSSTCYLLGSGAALLSFATCFPQMKPRLNGPSRGQRIKGLGWGGWGVALAAEMAVVSPRRPGGWFFPFTPSKMRRDMFQLCTATSISCALPSPALKHVRRVGGHAKNS